MFSKFATTLLSTVGASSAPVVAIIVYQQLKSSSIELTQTSSFEPKNDEQIIAVPEAEKPAIKTNTHTEEKKSSEPTKTEPPITPAPTKEKVTSPPTVEITTASKSENSAKKTNSQPKKTEDVKNDNKPQEILTDEQLKQLLNDFVSNSLNLAKNAEDNKNPDADQEVNKQIQQFVKLLSHKKNSLKDEGEKTKVTEIIDALSKLETKINVN